MIDISLVLPCWCVAMVDAVSLPAHASIHISLVLPCRCVAMVDADPRPCPPGKRGLLETCLSSQCFQSWPFHVVFAEVAGATMQASMWPSCLPCHGQRGAAAGPTGEATCLPVHVVLARTPGLSC